MTNQRRSSRPLPSSRTVVTWLRNPSCQILSFSHELHPSQLRELPGTARLTIFRSGPRRLVRLLSKTARLSFHVEAPVGGASFDDPVDAALLALGREMRVRVVSMDGSQEEELKMVRTILAKHAKAVKLKVGQRPV